ncbi:hypothetical protein HDZ31DRAFT_36985 [Schizophyllum fasciatum]
MFAPLAKVPLTPRAVKRSSQPIAVNTTSRDQHHPLNTRLLGKHEYMDAVILQELSGAIVSSIDGMPILIFPDRGFPVPADDLFNALIGSPLYDVGLQRWLNAPNFDAQYQERAIAAFFETLCHRARSFFKSHEKEVEVIRCWSAAYRHDPLPGGYMERKPDIISLVDDAPRLWSSICADVQHKANELDYKAAAQQLHDGGLNCLSTQDDRLYHVGIGIVGSTFFISYYDRSGCLQSKPVSVHTHPREFLRVLLGLTFMDKEFLGYDPTISDRDGQRYVTVRNVEYQIVQRIDEHPSVRGLGTVCWLCKRVSDGMSVVIKSSWVDTSRTRTEEDFLEMALAQQVRGVPTLVAYETVTYDGKCITTARFRKELCKPAQLKDVEDRELTRLVMAEHGSPLSSFTDKVELLSGLLDGVEAHQELYEKCGIVHGDVHDKNVLLDNGSLTAAKRRRGLLVDLNYAFKVGEQRERPSVGLKSCPAPFMACELLTHGKYIPHAYYHDLESFLYIIIWICSLYQGPEDSIRDDDDFDIMSKDMGKWMQGSPEDVGAAKAVIMEIKPPGMDTFTNFLDDHFDSYFDDLKECVWELRMKIMCRDPPPTHPDVIAILQKHIANRLSKEKPTKIVQDTS